MNSQAPKCPLRLSQQLAASSMQLAHEPSMTRSDPGRRDGPGFGPGLGPSPQGAAALQPAAARVGRPAGGIRAVLDANLAGPPPSTGPGPLARFLLSGAMGSQPDCGIQDASLPGVPQASATPPPLPHQELRGAGSLPQAGFASTSLSPMGPTDSCPTANLDELDLMTEAELAETSRLAGGRGVESLFQGYESALSATPRGASQLNQALKMDDPYMGLGGIAESFLLSAYHDGQQCHELGASPSTSGRSSPGLGRLGSHTAASAMSSGQSTGKARSAGAQLMPPLRAASMLSFGNTHATAPPLVESSTHSIALGSSSRHRSRLSASMPHHATGSLGGVGQSGAEWPQRRVSAAALERLLAESIASDSTEPQLERLLAASRASAGPADHSNSTALFASLLRHQSGEGMAPTGLGMSSASSSGAASVLFGSGLNDSADLSAMLAGAFPHGQAGNKQTGARSRMQSGMEALCALEAMHTGMQGSGVGAAQAGVSVAGQLGQLGSGFMRQAEEDPLIAALKGPLSWTPHKAQAPLARAPRADLLWPSSAPGATRDALASAGGVLSKSEAWDSPSSYDDLWQGAGRLGAGSVGGMGGGFREGAAKKGGMGGRAGGEEEKEDAKERERRERRMALNREAARRMRQRNAERLAELEKTVEALKKDGDEAARRLRLAESKVAQLEQTNEKLEGKLLRVASDIVQGDYAPHATKDSVLAVLRDLQPRMGQALLARTGSADKRAREGSCEEGSLKREKVMPSHCSHSDGEVPKPTQFVPSVAHA